MVPSKPKPKARRIKDSVCRSKMNGIKSCQHEASLSPITRGYEESFLNYSDARNIRNFTRHLILSAIEYGSNGKFDLKHGDAPETCFTKF